MKFSYNVYKEKVLETMKEVFASAKIEIHTKMKNNGVLKEGISIVSTGHKSAPIFWFQDNQEIYDEEDVEKFLSDAKNMYGIMTAPKDEVIELIYDWNYAKNLILPKLVDHEKNKEMLANIPHRHFLNFAVVPYLQLSAENEMNATVMVNNNLKRLWGVSCQEMQMMAEQNLEHIEHTFLSVKDMLPCGYLKNTESNPLHILSIENAGYGAAVILKKGIMDWVCEKLNAKKVFAIPSSIYEWLVLPAGESMDCLYMKNMIKEVNENIVVPEEVLCSELYMYDKESGNFGIVDDEGEFKYGQARFVYSGSFA